MVVRYGKLQLAKIEWEKVDSELAKVMDDYTERSNSLELFDYDADVYKDFIIPTSIDSLLKLHLYNAQCCPIPSKNNKYLTRFVLYGKSHSNMEGKLIITDLEIKSIGQEEFSEIDTKLRKIIDSYYVQSHQEV